MTPWFNGTPARVGWFAARYVGELGEDMRRFWDGRQWSAPVWSDSPAEHLDRARNTRGESQRGIEWRGIAALSMSADDLAHVYGPLPADRVIAEREVLLQALDLIDVRVDAHARTDARYRALVF